VMVYESALAPREGAVPEGPVSDMLHDNNASRVSVASEVLQEWERGRAAPQHSEHSANEQLQLCTRKCGCRICACVHGLAAVDFTAAV
jgi:hypothetical protein